MQGRRPFPGSRRRSLRAAPARRPHGGGMVMGMAAEREGGRREGWGSQHMLGGGRGGAKVVGGIANSVGKT